METESAVRLSPPIVVTAADRDSLLALARNTAGEVEVARILVRELERADVIPAVAHPDSLVVMGAVVDFVEDDTCTIRRARLVYPDEAHQPGCLSVLTALGAALIGLGPGQSIALPVDGAERRVRVLRVVAPGAPAPGGVLRPVGGPRREQRQSNRRAASGEVLRI